MLKKFWVLVVLLLVVAAVFLIWRLQQNTIYQLDVINSTEKSVDHVRLFGTALAKELKVEQLAPGGSRTLVAILKPEGDLKFEVLIGANRIDTFIEQDVLYIVYGIIGTYKAVVIYSSGTPGNIHTVYQLYIICKNINSGFWPITRHQKCRVS